MQGKNTRRELTRKNAPAGKYTSHLRVTAIRRRQRQRKACVRMYTVLMRRDISEDDAMHLGINASCGQASNLKKLLS